MDKLLKNTFSSREVAHKDSSKIKECSESEKLIKMEIEYIKKLEALKKKMLD